MYKLLSLFFLFMMSCQTKTITSSWEKDLVKSSKPLDPEAPLVIGHRGACGHIPEHTLESYALAINMGADYIEPDLVSTSDGVLISRHENDLSGTTDVAVKFPSRKKTKTVDGRKITGFFSEDFTLKEIKTLRAIQSIPERDQSHNGKYAVATFEEILKLAQKKSLELGRRIGVYVETKHPTYFKNIGLPLETKMLSHLKKYGYSSKQDPVFIQSFEVANLKELRKKTTIRLLQLLDEPDWRPYDLEAKGDPTTYLDMTTPKALKEISTYADAVGPWKRLIVLEDSTGALLPVNNFIQDAHAVGLHVHAYTFRSDKKYLNKAYKGDPVQEYLHFYKLGVDAVFTDFTDDAVKAREQLFSSIPAGKE